MKTVAFRGRLLLRKILTGLSLGAVTFIFQACYGTPPVTTDTTLRGTVKSSDTESPIPGIHVLSVGDNVLTDADGNYELFVANRIQTVLFKDIDGPENGEFQDKEVSWDPNNGPLNVSLNPK
jgi:hypothetical protein